VLARSRGGKNPVGLLFLGREIPREREEEKGGPPPATGERGAGFSKFFFSPKERETRSSKKREKEKKIRIPPAELDKKEQKKQTSGRVPFSFM